MKSPTRLAMTLAAAGLADAAYLSYERLTGGTVLCPVTGSGCETVQNSWYAAPWGIPIAYVGFVGYALMLLLAIAAHTHRTIRHGSPWTALKALVAFSVGASVVLVGIQAFVIGAFCFWCLVSAGIDVALCVVVFTRHAKPKAKVATKHQGRRVKKQARRWPLYAGIGAVLMLLIVSFILNRPAATVVATATNLTFPTKGDNNAKVTVIVYSDYQCPACAVFSTEFEPGFDREYVETGKVNVEFRDFPLSYHRNAVKAAMTARIAGDYGKYWLMHDLLFEKQSEWQDVANPDELFTSYASTLGIDRAAFAGALTNNAHRDEVVASGQAAMQAGIDATPTILVNGQKVSSWTSISTAVDQALAASSTTR